MNARWTLVGLAFLTVRCGGSGFDAAAAARTCPADFPALPAPAPPESADAGGDVDCVVATSGAVTVTLPCVAKGQDSPDLRTVAVNVFSQFPAIDGTPSDAGVLSGSLRIASVPGGPATYQASDAGSSLLASDVTLTLPDGGQWSQAFDGGTTELGTFRWDLVAMSTVGTVGPRRFYAVDGGYHGTLLGKDGCVAVTIGF